MLKDYHNAIARGVNPLIEIMSGGKSLEHILLNNCFSVIIAEIYECTKILSYASSTISYLEKKNKKN